ncbi:MAG TPA: hypothetical protein VK934_07950 [Fimbriimonas sp.]|nr:hypothetical protein [Fimbriimonas sp.]
MQASQNELAQVLTTNHPARPYLVLGGLIAGIGLIRNSFSSLAFLIAGGALVAKGLEEMKRTGQLHDGNYHGTNAPPSNR